MTDYAEMATAGIISTPGISINGKRVHSGGLPEAGALERWLSE